MLFGLSRSEKRQLDRIEQLLILMNQKGDYIMATLDDLIAKVQEQSTQLESLDAFVESLHEQINGMGLPPEAQQKVNKLFDDLKANDERIAKAFVANTPAEGTE